MASLITRRFVDYAKAEFRLDWHGIHGASHWARVRCNGLLLSARTGANRRVVEYFAFIHDLGRWNDDSDSEHGLRAAGLARELAGDLINVSDAELSLLVQACEGHSDGHLAADVTVMTCWDADRLDLGRVGIVPDPDRLCTEAARDADMLTAAYRRSIQGFL